jgi:large subunit ribosomal protein L14e
LHTHSHKHTHTGRAIRTAKLEKVYLESDVAGKFAATSWGKKLTRQNKRTNSSDFDRFNVMILRKKVPLLAIMF